MMKFKKTMGVLAGVLISVCLLSFGVAAAFDFETAAKDFVPSALNDIQLTPGDTHSPSAALWAQTGSPCYTQDASVVTVAQDGTVTAVGEGTAFVAYTASETMFQLYRYTVVKSATPVTDDDVPATDPDLPQTQQQEAIEMNQNFTETAENLNEIHENNVKQVQRPFTSTYLFILIPVLVFIVPIFVLAIWSAVSTVRFCRESMDRKILPPRFMNDSTVTASNELTHCPKCNVAFGDDLFCSVCGASKRPRGTYVVPIENSITAQELEKILNEWFACNPYVYDCTLKLKTKNALFTPFISRKFRVQSAVVEYSVADEVQYHQYGLAFIYKFRLFGPIGYSEDKHVAEWHENNSDCTIISTHGGRIQHTDNKGGIWAQYYNYVFFRK